MDKQLVRPMNNMEKKAIERDREPKAVEDRHYRRALKVQISQDERGMWWLVIDGGSPMVATDVEVMLWQELQAIKRKGVVVAYGQEVR